MAIKSQRVDITLGFHADMGQVRSQIDSLKQSLNQLMTSTTTGKSTQGFSERLKSAQEAAQQLDLALTRAFNKDTGKINITQFTQSLKSSGTSVQQLSTQLVNGGKQGQQAFLNLARSLQNVERSAISVNTVVSKFATTLYNNVRWQASSALLNTFTNRVSSAVSHLKEMDSALNAIRVVSGDTKAQMKGISDEAAHMAKNLKTSSTEIVKAELIYRQQGDSAELAAKKAEITTKAANVSFNSSAAQMSEYLTAIWNSYQVPEEQLELFVDKIAKIGATTATSMEEIAAAMQKVAATGNTVGVSYDQLASIIATVSSVTRQSAETVGTSFKTIFARIEDLKAGKTAEDGITLGNVSSKLLKLGIDVRDANGGLREMGDVINDLGESWSTLSKTQQTVISQTIGGARQYPMWMALMENWDMYKEALTEAMNAEGTLNEQQAIWAESWEAHAQAIQVSWEGLYNSLVKTDSFLKGMEGFSKFIDRLADTADAAGGLTPILVTLTTFVASKMTPQLVNGFNSIASNIDIVTGKAKEREIAAQKELAAQLKAISLSAAYTGTQKLEAQFLAENTDLKKQYLQIEDSLSNKQKEELASLNSVSQGWQEYAVNVQKGIDADKKYLTELPKKKVLNKYEAQTGGANLRGKGQYLGVSINKEKLAQVANDGIRAAYGQKADYAGLAEKIGASEKQIEKLKKAASTSQKKTIFAQIAQELGLITPKIQDFSKEFNKALANFETQSKNVGTIKQAFEGMDVSQLDAESAKAKLKELKIDFNQLTPAVQKYINDLKKGEFSNESFTKSVESGRNQLINQIVQLGDYGVSVDEIRKKLTELGYKEEEITAALKNHEEQQKKTQAAMESTQKTAKVAQAFTGVVSSVTSATMAVQTFSSTIENWNETDLLSKIISITMTLSMLPSIIGGVRSAVELLNLSLNATNVVTAVLTVALIALVAAFKAFQYFSLEGAVDRLKESEEKVKSIKSELEGIDQQIEDLEKKGAKINDQEWDTLQALKQQRIEKQAMLDLEETSTGKTRDYVNEKLEKPAIGTVWSGVFSEWWNNWLESLSWEDFFSLGTTRSFKNFSIEAEFFRQIGVQNRPTSELEFQKNEAAKKLGENYYRISSPIYDSNGDLLYSSGELVPESDYKKFIGSIRSDDQLVEKTSMSEEDKKDLRSFQEDYDQAFKDWSKRIKANYKAVKDLDYYEGDNLTSSQEAFNKSKFNTTVNYFVTLADEAENADDKLIQINRALDYFETRSEKLTRQAKIDIMDSDDYENSLAYAEVLKEIEEINPTLVQSYKDRVKQEKESYEVTKQLAKEMGISLESYDQLNDALAQIAEQTGIPQSAIQSLYDSGAMAKLAASELGGLKGALDKLANTTVDASGFITGLDALTGEAIAALAAVLSLANISIEWQANAGQELGEFAAATGRSNLYLGEGTLSSDRASELKNKGISLDAYHVVVKKNGKIVSGDGKSLGDILKSEMNKIWGTGGGSSSTDKTNIGSGGGDSSSKKDADKVWWDAYEAKRKQLDEQYDAGVLTQDQYLSDFDNLYTDLISHYNTACEEHKAKILEEMNDLREANAERALDLYKTMVDTIMDYGSGTFTWKNQQFTFTSVEAFENWANENLWNQTIKNPKTEENQSIYNKDDRDEIAQKQWDTAKKNAERDIARLSKAYDNEELEYDEYLKKISSLYYGSAYSPDVKGNKRFYTDDEIDSALGASQQESWFESQLQRYADEYNQAWLEGKAADVSATYQKLLAFWNAHPERHNKNTRATLVSVIQNLKKQAKENIQKEENLGWIDAYAANDQRAIVDLLGIKDFEPELLPELASDQLSSYKSFKQSRLNRLGYGDYIDGSDKELAKNTYKEILDVNVQALKEIIKTSGVESDEFKEIAAELKSNSEKYLEAVFSFEKDFEKYKEKSNLLGWKNNDSEFIASTRYWAKIISTGIQGVIDVLIAEGYRLEDAYAFAEDKLIAGLQQLQSAALQQLTWVKEDALDTYNQMKATLENTVSGNKTNFDYQKELRDSLHEINKELATSLTMYDYLDEETRKLLFNTEDYAILSEKITDLQEEGNALTEQYLKDIQGKSAEEQELITQAYEAQMELKSKEFAIAKQDLEVTKKKLALQNVLNERNTRMFLNGRWTWVASQEEVAQAQQDLMDAQYEMESARLELEFTQEQEKLNSRVRDCQEAINQINKEFEKFQDMINGRTHAIGTDLSDFETEVENITGKILAAREDFELKLAEIEKKADYLENIEKKANKDGSLILDDGYVANKDSGTFSDMGGYYDYYSPSSSGGVYVRRGSLTKHALGGIFSSPHIGQVAEDGAEAIIPLSDKYRQRGLDLWARAGQILGLIQQPSLKTNLPSSGEDASVQQNVIVNIHNDDSTSDFFEFNNLV